jgi:hypothetical protein
VVAVANPFRSSIRARLKQLFAPYALLFWVITVLHATSSETNGSGMQVRSQSRGCSMRHIIPHVLIPHVIAGIVVVAAVGAGAANTIECKAELPTTRTGYWSWRVIDGKRCWYPGRPGIAKSQLQWPAEAATAGAPSAADTSWPEPVSVEAESTFSRSKELPFEQRWPR